MGHLHHLPPAFPAPQLNGKAERRVWGAARRGRRAVTATWARAIAAAAPRPHPAGLTSPCVSSGTFIGRRQPRQLAARWFAVLASPTPRPWLHPPLPRFPAGPAKPGPEISGLDVAAAPLRPALGEGGGAGAGGGSGRGGGEAAKPGALGYTGSACPE